MTAPAVTVRFRPWRALPWTGWVVDVVLLPLRLLLALVRLAARVEWTPDAVVAAVVLGLPATAGLGFGLAHTSWTGLAGLYRGVGGTVVLAVVLLALVTGGATRSATGRMSCGHAAPTGGSPDRRRQFIADHEAGHMAGAKHVGGRRISAAIEPGDRGGVTSAQLPCADLRQAVHDDLVMSRAGRRAVGSDWGAGWDMGQERRTLAMLPPGERAAVSRAADRSVRRALSRHSGDRRRWAHALGRDGQVSA